MEDTSRRNLLKAAAAGGVAATALVAAMSAGRTAGAQGHAHGQSRPLSGNHALATVSFGQWQADPDAPFDRQPTNSDRTRNVHDLLPFEVEIDEGGAVSFIISGLHQIQVYTDAQTLAQLQALSKNPANQLAGVPPLLNYAPDRVYRGLDPRVLTYATLAGNPPAPLLVQDRVESVNFPKAGRYLVVCGVIPHLVDSMHGYVTVREKRPE